MNLWKKYCTLSRIRQIAAVVVLLHFLGICVLSANHLLGARKTPKTKIAVRTVYPAIAQVTTTTPSPSAAKTTARTQPASPVHKTVSPKKSPPKKESPKPSKSNEHLPSKISKNDEALLKEIAENLEILNSEAKITSNPPLVLPTTLPKTIQLEEPDLTDFSYAEILIAYLQNALDLPEYGEVKVRLQLEADGRLARCEILESHNRKNEEFLKKRLPELVFPQTDGNGTLSFTITFKN